MAFTWLSLLVALAGRGHYEYERRRGRQIRARRTKRGSTYSFDDLNVLLLIDVIPFSGLDLFEIECLPVLFEAVDEIIRDELDTLEEKLRRKCPVKTGKAKSSIYTSTGYSAGGFTPSAGKGGVITRFEAPYSGTPFIAGMEVDYAIYITEPWWGIACHEWWDETATYAANRAHAYWLICIEKLKKAKARKKPAPIVVPG